jgi:hypothetical protein
VCTDFVWADMYILTDQFLEVYRSSPGKLVIIRNFPSLGLYEERCMIPIQTLSIPKLTSSILSAYGCSYLELGNAIGNQIWVTVQSAAAVAPPTVNDYYRRASDGTTCEPPAAEHW